MADPAPPGSGRRLARSAELDARAAAFIARRDFEPVTAWALLLGVLFAWATLCLFTATRWWPAAPGSVPLVLFGSLAAGGCLFVADWGTQQQVLGFRSLLIDRQWQVRAAVFSPSGVQGAARSLGWTDRTVRCVWVGAVVLGVVGVAGSGLAHLTMG